MLVRTNTLICMEYRCVEERKNLKLFNIKDFKLINEKIYINKRINKLCIRRRKRISKKLKKCLEKNEIEGIILSKSLKKDIELINELKIQGIKIIDGKRLIKYLAQEIVEYILKFINKDKQNTRIAILSNELSDTIIEKIRIFSTKYKELTVITNHPNKIMNLEKEIYEDFGTSIIITNNKQKALIKSDIILNFDFIEDALNKYKINNNAIIVNFEDKFKINNKRFMGINIYDYEIICESEDMDDYKDYDIKDIIEGKIRFNTSFDNIRKMINEKQIKIKTLITFRENII